MQLRSATAVGKFWIIVGKWFHCVHEVPCSVAAVTLPDVFLFDSVWIAISVENNWVQSLLGHAMLCTGLGAGLETRLGTGLKEGPHSHDKLWLRFLISSRSTFVPRISKSKDVTRWLRFKSRATATSRTTSSSRETTLWLLCAGGFR